MSSWIVERGERGNGEIAMFPVAIRSFTSKRMICRLPLALKRGTCLGTLWVLFPPSLPVNRERTVFVMKFPDPCGAGYNELGLANLPAKQRPSCGLSSPGVLTVALCNLTRRSQPWEPTCSCRV